MFSRKTFDFLFENRLNNSKKWFLDHKNDYNEYVLNPLMELAVMLAPTISSIDMQIITEPKVDKTISRIYRDTRFSKDKSLYRNEIWLSYRRDKKTFPQYPEFFFVVMPDKFIYGCGYYAASTQTMENMRSLILKKDPFFLKAQEAFERQSDFVMEGDTYKKTKHPDQPMNIREWLDRKGICVICKSNDLLLLYSDELPKKITAAYKEMEPIGGFFGSGESTGSIGVVTINIPRIAYLSQNESEFYIRLDKMMDIAARSLKTKRNTVTQLLENGMYPYTKRYLGSFENHFSTIGLVGMNEATLNAKWLKTDLTDPKAQKFAQDVLNHMRNRLSDYQEQYGDLYNLEATPAESTAYRLAKHDVKQFPDTITAAKNKDETPYYTNSSHLPVGYTEDVFAALAIQDDLQTLYTSGTVFHTFLGEKLSGWKALFFFFFFQVAILYFITYLFYM
jgi:uncharacterized protein (TIGR02453 family)